MKKIIVMILMVVMLVGLTACGENHTCTKITRATAYGVETEYQIDGEIVSESVYYTFGGR